MSSDLFFYTSSDDEDEVNSELAMFTEACQAAYEASKPKLQRTPVERDRYGAHDRLVMAYFSEHPQDDCTGQLGISSLMKCTSAIRQLAYGSVPDSLDEYLQMGATTARKSLQIFCKVIMNLYGEEFLHKPTYTDMEKLYARHDEKHGFPRMLGSIDCTHWMWAHCPVAYRAQFSRGRNDHKRILYKTKHEAARKDVERAFGDNGEAISPDFFREEQHRADDPVRTHEESIIELGMKALDDDDGDMLMFISSLDSRYIAKKDNGEAISPDFFREEQHRADDPVRTHEESMIEDDYVDVLDILAWIQVRLRRNHLGYAVIFGQKDNGEAISPDFFREEQHRADDPVRTHEESMKALDDDDGDMLMFISSLDLRMA
ncbi:ALP1-like protein [Tanacetum coccineum]